MEDNSEVTLQVEHLTKKFGGLTAVDDLSFELDDEIVGLMGPNGSGKSTTVNCISGVYDPTDGTICHHGTDITDEPIHRCARRGIARTFQTPRVFEDLTVMENTMMPLLNTDVTMETAESEAREALESVDLLRLQTHRAKELSGGQKKLLEFARNLMLDPDVVFLDEPFAGIHPELKEIMHERIADLRDSSTDFIVVSHEVQALYDISDRILVLDRGSIISDGSAEEVQDDDRVIEAYLGGAT